MPPLLPLAQLRHRRSRNRIRVKARIQTEHNTRIRRLIEARGWHASTQRLSATSLDLDIDALGVRLCAIRLARGVECDDFVPEDVVAGCQVGDGQVPGEVVLDQVVGDPGAGVGAGFPCAGLDLGPAEGGRVGDGGEVARDGGYIFLHRAGVGDGPGVLECVSAYRIFSSALELGCGGRRDGLAEGNEDNIPI